MEQLTKREIFIKELSELIESFGTDINDVFSPEALEYYNDFLKGKASTGGLTESGEKILNYMKENKSTYNNIFNAKTIGEGLFMPPRSVSGAMRKLISDGYAFKTPGNPVTYSLKD
jgi:hypothetical protein